MAQNNSKAAALRAKLDVHKPALAMAAHNPLAAKLAANAGFDAIWGSGFELSASYAVPDANILSVDTHLELMRAMREVQNAPVIADIDTGYGNAVNVAYLVPRYAAAGIPEAWLVGLAGDAISVCRQPGPDGYAEIVTVTRAETLRPLLLPGVAVAVDQILG